MALGVVWRRVELPATQGMGVEQALGTATSTRCV
jgi:hypothetical protein